MEVKDIIPLVPNWPSLVTALASIAFPFVSQFKKLDDFHFEARPWHMKEVFNVFGSIVSTAVIVYSFLTGCEGLISYGNWRLPDWFLSIISGLLFAEIQFGLVFQFKDSIKQKKSRCPIVVIVLSLIIYMGIFFFFSYGFNKLAITKTHSIFQGTVLDENDAATAGAAVYLQGKQGTGFEMEGFTTTDGSFAFCLTDKEAEQFNRVRINKKGFKEFAKTLPSRKTFSQRLQLTLVKEPDQR